MNACVEIDTHTVPPPSPTSIRIAYLTSSWSGGTSTRHATLMVNLDPKTLCHACCAAWSLLNSCMALSNTFLKRGWKLKGHHIKGSPTTAWEANPYGFVGRVKAVALPMSLKAGLQTPARLRRSNAMCLNDRNVSMQWEFLLRRSMKPDIHERCTWTG